MNSPCVGPKKARGEQPPWFFRSSPFALRPSLLALRPSPLSPRRSPLGFAHSRTTSRGSLSLRSPLKDGWRRMPAWVHWANSTSAISCGWTYLACGRTLPSTNGLRSTARPAQSGQQFVSGPGRETGADGTGVMERLRFAQAASLLGAEVVIAHEDRAERTLLPTPAGSVAADDEFLSALNLDLEPVARAVAGLVDAFEAFGHHALQATLARDSEHFAAVPGFPGGRLPVGAGQTQALQDLAPPRIGKPARGLSVKVQDVEKKDRYRHLADELGDGGGVADVHPPLEEFEARAKVGIQGHDLAVEDGATPAETAAKRRDLRILGGHVQEVAALDEQAAGVPVQNRSHAVPFELEAVVVLIARHRGGQARHRHDVPGERLWRAEVGGRAVSARPGRCARLAS